MQSKNGGVYVEGNVHSYGDAVLLAVSVQPVLRLGELRVKTDVKDYARVQCE